jgi:hypothetical protein
MGSCYSEGLLCCLHLGIQHALKEEDNRFLRLGVEHALQKKICTPTRYYTRELSHNHNHYLDNIKSRLVYIEKYTDFWIYSGKYWQFPTLTMIFTKYSSVELFVQVTALADTMTTQLHWQSTHRIWKFRQRQVVRHRQSNKLQSWPKHRSLNYITFGKARLGDNHKFLQNTKLLFWFS